MRTAYEMLKNRVIVAVYDGRADGSFLLRLDDRTEIVITSGMIRNQEDEPLSIPEVVADGDDCEKCG